MSLFAFYLSIFTMQCSARLLCNKQVINHLYEAEGIYVLMVGGIGFNNYFSILEKLGISCVIKTDNDLRGSSGGKFSVLGFSRCNRYIGEKILPTSRIDNSTVSAKRELYNANIIKPDMIREEYGIYLSKCEQFYNY
ncbi:hypothetical protein M3650_28855 [Paenibacillus sp. MER TA 81-3]|nr:hypothetical protein [Paenibacillus sp. MER TA 81-3]